MNTLVENKYMKEMQCGANFSYILEDNNAFLSTEYKVLQSQINSCFVKCMKMQYNGKVQIYYLTGKYKQLSALFPTLDADSFMVICSNLIANIIDVKSNGFLSCQNIDLSFERIYVDPSTYRVHLIYIPVAKRLFDDTFVFENELRTSLVKIIQGVSTLNTPKTIQFAANLSSSSLSLENLYTSIKTGKSFTPASESYKDMGVFAHSTQMKLVAMNAPTRIEIIITKNDFTIGKKAEIVDGVIGFNKMISRSHCKITKSDNVYFITDLHSVNGTFVNHVRLLPDQPQAIKNGDIIRLANSDFQVIEE